MNYFVFLNFFIAASQSPSKPGPSKRRQRTPAASPQQILYVPEHVLRSLDAGQWLNADIINAYIIDCIRRYDREKSMAFLPTYYEARRKYKATHYWSMRGKSDADVTTLIMPRFVGNNHFILAIYHEGDTIIYDSLHLYANYIVPDDLQRQLTSILNDCFGSGVIYFIM